MLSPVASAERNLDAKLPCREHRSVSSQDNGKSQD